MEQHTDSDLNRKISMAKSFLDSAQLLERTTNHIVAEPQEAEVLTKSEKKKEAKIADTKFKRKMTTHFLYAMIFELCIKIIWEIEHNAPPKPNHDIFSRYQELSKESRQAISEMYDTQVANTKYIISQANGQVDNHGNVVKINIPLQSLEEALKSNAQVIRDFKYDGKLNGNSSVFASIIWDDKEISLLPTAKLVVFPERLLEYAISLNTQ